MHKLRDFIIDSVAGTGGHLASNLGVVELTQALHAVFNPFIDRIVWDVGHQSYVHKLLTDREARFPTLRQFGGMSGFPKPSESEADAFIAGHASNSVSVALGMARARTLLNADYNIVCVIGDGALTGGLAYEGLNNAGQSKERLVVVLNDNEMSIAPATGAVARLLKTLAERSSYYRFKRGYRRFLRRFKAGDRIYRFTHNVKTSLKRAVLNGRVNIFEDLGFRYFGPVDGHDVERLMFFFEQAKDFDGPALVHVLTTKGKGYAPAERDPDLYHGVPPFDVVAGVRPSETPTFSTVFGGELVRLAATNDKICAVTAAMPDGTGLSEFAKRFPNRFFDEGIAEAHALTMSAGLAKQGMRPVFAVYSTFLQRAFDSLLHDVCILSLPVVIVIDRAGLVGEDGETHHGTFDLALLQTAPNLEIYCPSDFSELKATLQAAFEQSDHPVAIRYPRGGEAATTVNAVPAQKSATPQITVVSYGAMSAPTLTAIERSGIAAEFVKLVKVKPLDVTEIAASAAKTGRLAVVEDVAAFGCVGERIISELAKLGVVPKRVLLKNCGTNFVTHGSICDLHTALGLDPISLAKAFQEIVI